MFKRLGIVIGIAIAIIIVGGAYWWLSKWVLGLSFITGDEATWGMAAVWAIYVMPIPLGFVIGICYCIFYPIILLVGWIITGSGPSAIHKSFDPYIPDISEQEMEETKILAALDAEYPGMEK